MPHIVQGVYISHFISSSPPLSLSEVSNTVPIWQLTDKETEPQKSWTTCPRSRGSWKIHTQAFLTAKFMLLPWSLQKSENCCKSKIIIFISIIIIPLIYMASSSAVLKAAARAWRVNGTHVAIRFLITEHGIQVATHKATVWIPLIRTFCTMY